MFAVRCSLFWCMLNCIWTGRMNKYSFICVRAFTLLIRWKMKRRRTGIGTNYTFKYVYGSAVRHSFWFRFSKSFALKSSILVLCSIHRYNFNLQCFRNSQFAIEHPCYWALKYFFIPVDRTRFVYVCNSFDNDRQQELFSYLAPSVQKLFLSYLLFDVAFFLFCFMFFLFVLVFISVFPHRMSSRFTCMRFALIKKKLILFVSCLRSRESKHRVTNVAESKKKCE